MNKSVSFRIFLALVVVLGLLAAANVFLPQDASGVSIPAAPLPAPLPVVALVAGVGVMVIYGAFGLLGLFLARKLGLPEIWDVAVTNRQRFLIPAMVGAAIGVVIILGDIIFAPVNGLGHIPHPPFPTSIVAALAAGIGEETLFRLFFISFWTWLISRIILRGRRQTTVFAIVSLFSALAFGLGHLPGFMYMQGWNSLSQVPAMLMTELLALNGLLSIAAAYFFKKYGFLAPVGIHFWADVVWHVIWGLL